jgi:hypothetical protein
LLCSGPPDPEKSCAVSLLLSAILADYSMTHIIVIDPHNEYGRAFGRTAEVVNIDNLQLPFWLFDSEEAVGILVRGGTAQEQEAQGRCCQVNLWRSEKAKAACAITVRPPHFAIRSPPRLEKSAALIARRDGVEH